MTLHYVTLAGASEPYEVYGGQTACDNALIKRSGEGGVAYRALDPGGDGRRRLLADATAWIDAILASGTPTGAGGTTLRVPLEDILNTDGSAMSDADQMALAARAAFEAVAILAVDPDAPAAIDTGSNIRKLDAGGGTGIEFFTSTSARDGTAATYPVALTRILAPLLGGGATASTATSGFSSGTSCRSSFDDCDAFTRNGPF